MPTSIYTEPISIYTDDLLLEYTKYPKDSGATIIYREDLHFQSGSSDKVHIGIKVEHNNSTKWWCLYGRRGRKLTPMQYSSATWQERLDEKRRKGYQNVCVNQYSAINDEQESDTAKVTTWEPMVLWPMGATATPKDLTKIGALIDNPDYIYEYKYDGVRVTLHILPDGRGCKLFGRRGTQDNPGMPNEFTLKVPHISKLEFTETFGDTILDGELLSTKYNTGHEDAAKISGDLHAKDNRDTSHMYFVAFDIVKLNDMKLLDKPWKERRTFLTAAINKMTEVGVSFKISQYTIKNKEEMHNKIIASGGEGGIFKNIYGTYKPGVKPANNWIKWKKEETHDVVIMGFTDAEPGKYNNAEQQLIGAVKFGQYVKDNRPDTVKKVVKDAFPGGYGYGFLAYGVQLNNTFVKHWFEDNGDFYALKELGTCSGMTDNQRKDFTENQEQYLGQVMEINTHKRNTSGAFTWPRFIRLRPDKAFEDCRWEDKTKKPTKKAIKKGT